MPWAVAGTETEPRRRALSFAVLAPNPHNRQPWVADLSVPDTITLTCDLDRRLPETDPFDRQITIGLGCFLELLTMAAASQGIRADVQLFPEGEPQPRLDGRPVARITFVPDADIKPDPLFAHVLDRRSNKEPYDPTRAVAEDLLKQISQAAGHGRVGSTSAADRVTELRSLAWAAMETELTTYRTARESVDLMRIGRAEIEASPDGIDLSGAFIEALSLAGLLSRDAMLDPTTTTFRQQLPILKAPFDTAMAFTWLVTPANGRVDQIHAGSDHIRMNLAATALGVSIHPMSQALQEFDEMRPHFDRLRDSLGVGADEALQMFCRLGYGPDVAAAPRWPYATRIRSA